MELNAILRGSSEPCSGIPQILPSSRTASMSSHKANTNIPHALKCKHFCFTFDLHNYCPTCRETGRGDDPCVMHEKPCQLCSSFTEEQNCKIRNRKPYSRKHKSDSSKDKLDLLGDPDIEKEVYSFPLEAST